MLLDKLKVRNEALLRANSLLNRAIPATESSPLAPAPASVRKRTMPKEFVAPDPGPTAVIATSHSSAESDDIEGQEVKGALAVSEQQGGARSETRKTVPRSGKAANFQPLPETSQTCGTQSQKPTKHMRDAATKPIPPAVSTRAPLAPVSTQKPSYPRAALSDKAALASCKPATVSLSSKVPLKPSPALSSRQPPKSASSDTRNLLAALHALKRPS
jgi:hypothetical protein